MEIIVTGMPTPQFKGVRAAPPKWSVMCELVQHDLPDQIPVRTSSVSAAVWPWAGRLTFICCNTCKMELMILLTWSNARVVGRLKWAATSEAHAGTHEAFRCWLYVNSCSFYTYLSFRYCSRCPGGSGEHRLSPALGNVCLSWGDKQ